MLWSGRGQVEEATACCVFSCTRVHVYTTHWLLAGGRSGRRKPCTSVILKNKRNKQIHTIRHSAVIMITINDALLRATALPCYVRPCRLYMSRNCTASCTLHKTRACCLRCAINAEQLSSRAAFDLYRPLSTRKHAVGTLSTYVSYCCLHIERTMCLRQRGGKRVFWYVHFQAFKNN